MDMTMGNITTAIVVGIMFGSCAPARTADERENVRHERIYLLHADAGEVARMLGGVLGAPRVRRPAAPARMMRSGATPDPSREPELVVRAWLAPGREALAAEQGVRGAISRNLLPGQMGPPIPIPGQNALLVTGTPAELDAFREILQLIDVPQPQVRIRADILNVMGRAEEALGLDFGLWAGPVDVGTAGNVPPDAGIALRFGTADLRAVLGATQMQTRGMERAGAEVLTTSLVPAFISAGVMVPYFVPETTVTQGGVTTQFAPVSAFVGVELYVLPRVNADDTVSMRIRPALIDETGTVVGPGGAAPITKQTVTDALIRVRDGETVCIGGLPRRQEISSTSLGPLGRRRVTDDSELVVFVTPTILRPVGKPR